MKTLGGLKTKLNIFYLESLLYNIHIRIRYAHDTVYAKGGAYKRYSDSPVSGQLDKASAYAFIVSFVAFMVLQVAFPYFFTFKPRQVRVQNKLTKREKRFWPSQNDKRKMFFNSLSSYFLTV